MTQYTHIRNATGKLTIKNTTFLIIYSKVTSYFCAKYSGQRTYYLPRL